MEWIKDQQHLAQLLEGEGLCVLLFYGSFSASAKRALREMEEFSKQYGDARVYVVDVQSAPEAARQFGVQTVPVALAIENGEAKFRLDGVQNARFYARAFAGAASSAVSAGVARRPRNVVVYTSSACSPCRTLKSYLRRHGVAFREVDIVSDPRAAERLMQRSGRMAVPQTEIDGRVVVGFDQAKLNSLLGIDTDGDER